MAAPLCTDVHLTVLLLLSLTTVPVLLSCIQTSPVQCQCYVNATLTLDKLLQTVKPQTQILIINGRVNEVDYGTFYQGNLQNVITLQMDKVGLKDVDVVAFEHLSKLRNLSLAGNKLTTSEITLTQTLNVLNLEYNELTELPKGLNCLKELNFRGNKMLELREDDVIYPCLKKLNIAENGLKYVKYNFAELESLDLSDNKLIWENCNIIASNLKELVLKSSEYPQNNLEFLIGFPNLEILDLSHCDLPRIPHSLGIVNTSLHVLKLSKNSLKELIEDAFENLREVRRLYLDSCQVERIIGRPFAKFEDLEILDLSYNQIGAINETYLSSNVVELSLRHSQIKNIKPGSFNNLPRLDMLDLSQNLLRSVFSDFFPNLTSATIDLTGNPIWCDCYVRNIRDWVKENQVNMSVYCATPVKLLNRAVLSLKDEELDCRPPVFQDCCIKTVNAYVNSNLTIHFQTHAKPFATMSYDVINGDPLPLNRTRYTPTGHSVIIHNVTMDNNGNFSCTAENEFGRNTIYVEVNILPGNPQQFKLRLAEIIVIILVCSVVVFSVTWFCVFVCSKNRYFVIIPWVDDDECESSYGSIQVR